MGGSNTRTKQPPIAYREEGEPPVSAQEEATIERLLNQGMSGSANESPSAYFESLKSFGKEFIQDKSPNSYGRQASPAPVLDKNK